MDTFEKNCVTGSATDHRVRRDVFPFAAVIGQEKIKSALIWNLINPRIGGVLISGEKGTAKSTLVRGAAALSDGMRIVELPLNITEDRLIGTIDLKTALRDGKRELEDGLLRQADGNILYIDEVNLLSDYIVSDLVSAAGNGENIVEREGLSERHESRFILVGSMNPEEGKLRPQFLDRFGLYVEAESEKAMDDRMEIMRRRLEFERDSAAFAMNFAEDTAAVRKKIQTGRAHLAKVSISDSALQLAADLSSQAMCAGHRAEMVIIQTARAIAAYDGRKMINLDDIKTASEYALPHRARNTEQPMQQAELLENPDHEESNPPEYEDGPDDQMNNGPDKDRAERGDSEEEQEQQRGSDEPYTPPENAGEDSRQDMPGDGYSGDTDYDDSDLSPGSEDEDIQAPGEIFLIPKWQDSPVGRNTNPGTGRRNRVCSTGSQGRYVRYRIAGDEKVTDLAFDATVRAAAPLQRYRERGGRAIAIENDDMRVKIREKRAGGYILFVVDASASMGANKRMSAVKGAILSMLNMSYQKRDQVALIAFRKDEAELLLGFTRSVELAQKQLEILPTGGKTPLYKGLDLAYEVVMGLKRRDKDALPTIVLVSDGRASGSVRGERPFDMALQSAGRIGNQKIDTIILDTESDFIRFHLCDKLNEKMHGTVVTMESLCSEGIVRTLEVYKRKQNDI